MKSLMVMVFVSALLFLQTVTALSALKYLWQSPSINGNKYQNRDSMPRSIRKTLTNNNIDTVAEQKVAPQTKLESAYLSTDSNQAPQLQSNHGINKFKQYIQLASAIASVNRLSESAVPQIDSVITSLEPNYPADSKVREFTSDMRYFVNNRDALKLWSYMEPGLKPFEELADSYPSIFNPILTFVDWIIHEIAERSVPVFRQVVAMAEAARGDSKDREAVSKKFKQYVQLTSVGANIARLSPTEAQEIDSVLADVETKYPADTEVGGFFSSMRSMVRNRNGLRLWDFTEHNLKSVEELAAHDPDIFNPVFYAADAVILEMARRVSLAVQHFGEAARNGRLQSPLSLE